MEIKLKKRGIIRDHRLEGQAGIDDLIVKEDLINPEKEKVMIYFKGSQASGILTFTKNEIEKLSSTFRAKTDFIKGIKKIK